MGIEMGIILHTLYHYDCCVCSLLNISIDIYFK